MAYVIVLVVLAGAIYLISAPLRAERERRQTDSQANRIAELEAARDAKYREIRDAELDVRTGKLSNEDYDAIDRTLRAEAIEIMHALDTADPAHALDTADPAHALDTADPAVETAEPAGGNGGQPEP